MNYQGAFIHEADPIRNLLNRQISTVEIEFSISRHPKVSQVVVVPMCLDIQGQALTAFIALKDGVGETQELRNELTKWLRDAIGPDSTPATVHLTSTLPKTRSGKIMRDILQEMAQTEASHQ